jgi:hypothetical protein
VQWHSIARRMGNRISDKYYKAHKKRTTENKTRTFLSLILKHKYEITSENKINAVLYLIKFRFLFKKRKKKH